MKTQLFVLEHECLMYAVLISQVALGLEHVLSEGLLPANYQGVFLKAAALCDEIVLGGCKTPNSTTTEGITNATLLFSNLTKNYPEIYRCFTSYESIEGIAETLEHLASDEALPHAFPPEWILSVREFFVSIWIALKTECANEGISINLDLGQFPDVSTNPQ